MKCEIGKVVEYNGVKGTIVTTNNKYMFLNSDITEEVNVGDIVRFRDEKVHNVDRAYFVKKIPLNKEMAKTYFKDKN